jgi:hypothetical protein
MESLSSVSVPRFEPGSSRIKSRVANHSTAIFSASVELRGLCAVNWKGWEDTGRQLNRLLPGPDQRVNVGTSSLMCTHDLMNFIKPGDMFKF